LPAEEVVRQRRNLHQAGGRIGKRRESEGRRDGQGGRQQEGGTGMVREGRG